MSALLRCWHSSNQETPSTLGLSAVGIAQSLDDVALSHMIAFLSVAHSAWGRDPEYYRLWSNLNLTLCLWLWNRLVIDRDRSGLKRYITLDIPKFKKCLMSLSADGDYVSWLLGRGLNERDRSPAYGRIKAIFARRLGEADASLGKKPVLPSPAWHSGGGQKY